MLRVTELCRYSGDSADSIIAELRGYEKEFIPKANLGTFWHSWILRADRESVPANIVVIESKDYRSKLAQKARNKAISEDKTPVLQKEYETFLQGFNFLKSKLYEIFPINSYFEYEIKGDLDGLELVGHIDCMNENKVVDLKISEVNVKLDKHIFDMRYNLQLYLYMLLSKREYAELVFINPKSLTIYIKSLKMAELKDECEVLIKKAIDNMRVVNKALSEPLVVRSDYVIPQWAIANLS